MLYRLLSTLDPEQFAPLVVSLGDEGHFALPIRDLGITVKVLRLNPRLPNPLKIVQLKKWLIDFKPDIVQTWMYHADLIGGLTAKWAGNVPVVWGIHNSTLGKKSFTLTHLLRWILARISQKLPTAIITCSSRAQEVHTKLGYPSNTMKFIPNGFDLQQFAPSASHRKEMRGQLGISGSDSVIGMVARFHPQKDYHNFIKALAIFSGMEPDMHFLLCGEGVSVGNKVLEGWIDDTGVKAKVQLLGPRDDIPQLLNAMDVFTLSSAYGEAFPLSVGEAMSTGLPCAVTDVGDSAYLVADTGKVVPPKDPVSLAQAWNDLLNLSPKRRKDLGIKARNRIQDHFSIAKIGEEYASFYKRLHDQQISE